MSAQSILFATLIVEACLYGILVIRTDLHQKRMVKDRVQRRVGMVSR